MRSGRLAAIGGWGTRSAVIARDVPVGRPHAIAPHLVQSPVAMLSVLAHLAVPFITFDASGRSTDVSAGARALLASSLEKVSRFGATLVERLLAGSSRVATAEPICATSPVGGWQLRAQLLPAGDRTRVAVLLILPMQAPVSSSDCGRWGLTRREAEVAELIASGSSTRDIAATLGISLHTVRRHTERIFAKVGVKTRTQLTVMLAATTRAASNAPFEK